MSNDMNSPLNEIKDNSASRAEGADYYGNYYGDYQTTSENKKITHSKPPKNTKTNFKIPLILILVFILLALSIYFIMLLTSSSQGNKNTMVTSTPFITSTPNPAPFVEITNSPDPTIIPTVPPATTTPLVTKRPQRTKKPRKTKAPATQTKEPTITKKPIYPSNPSISEPKKQPVSTKVPGDTKEVEANTENISPEIIIE